MNETQKKPAPLGIVIINYRTAAMTIDCLDTLAIEIERHTNVRVVIVDNLSGDDSPDIIEQAIAQRGWSDWCELLRSPVNGGFSSGNNVGMKHLRETGDAEAYLLLNSDTLVRPGAIGSMLQALHDNPKTGIVGVRLEWPNGEAQVSTFRYRTPISEFLGAAATGPLTKLFSGSETSMPVRDEPFEPEWVSFACCLIRKTVIDDIGLMDEGYFMYFEDIDTCRRAKKAGHGVLYWPNAHVVHLRGGTSSVKQNAAQRKRLPAYYYAARSRYFAKWYGLPGLWMTNGLWLLGRAIAKCRELAGRPTHISDRASRDIWTHAIHPLRPYRP